MQEKAEQKEKQLIRGFLFACTQKIENECLNRLLFGTDRVYGPVVIRMRKGDLIFLNNVNTNVLYGVFKAVSDGIFNIEPDAFEGKYPYQIRVIPLGQIMKLENADKILSKFKVKRNTPLLGKKLIGILDLFLRSHTTGNMDDETVRLISDERTKIMKRIDERDIEDEIPLIESTTFWDFPRQSYGLTPKGHNKYPGVTPALIIFNLVWRYTNPGDLVVDPMAGSGTTYDVCMAEKRRAICYDIVPSRPEVIQNDARKIPLDDSSVDMVFVDSPYGDNIRYNDHPDNIGNISCESEKFYDELEKVMRECHRILKPGKVLAWLIGDQWVRNRFTPVGFKIYEKLCKYFETVDIVCVVRRGQSSNTNVWHNRARRFNFFLRGFKYLFIMRKPSGEKDAKPRKIKWHFYERN